MVMWPMITARTRREFSTLFHILCDTQQDEPVYFPICATGNGVIHGQEDVHRNYYLSSPSSWSRKKGIKETK